MDFDTTIQTFITTNNISKGIDLSCDLSYEGILKRISNKNLVLYCENSEYFQQLIKAITDSDDDIQLDKVQLYELFTLMVYIKSIILIKTDMGREIATKFLTYILTTFCEFKYNGCITCTTQFIKEITRLSDDEVFMMSPCQRAAIYLPSIKQNMGEKLE